MALSYKHNFVSAKTDGTDTSVLRPSDWNAEHVITCATNVILGRNTAGAGAVEELPTSDAVIALLASATLADLLTAMGVSPPTTGDGRITLKTTAPTGWLMMNDGTFGNAASGGTARANADTSALFVLLYDNTVDASCAVTTSAGAATTRAAQGTAATAYAANCRMALPKALGRAIVGAGSGATLTARALGSSFGQEATSLVDGQIPSLTASGNNSIAVSSVQGNIPSGMTSAGTIEAFGTYYGVLGGAGGTVPPTIGTINSTGVNSISVTYANGSQSAVPTQPPGAAWNVMVKL